MALSLQEANRVVDGALAKARELNIRLSVVEGACGVGGGTSQQDEDCARAGVAQLWHAALKVNIVNAVIT